MLEESVGNNLGTFILFVVQRRGGISQTGSRIPTPRTVLLPLSNGVLLNESDHIFLFIWWLGSLEQIGVHFNPSGDRTQVPERETRQVLTLPAL